MNIRKVTQDVRLSINLSATVAQALQDMADERHTTITEVVRSAISTEYILNEEHKRGSEILIRRNRYDYKMVWGSCEFWGQ